MILHGSKSHLQYVTLTVQSNSIDYVNHIQKCRKLNFDLLATDYNNKALGKKFGNLLKTIIYKYREAYCIAYNSRITFQNL